MVTSLKYLKYSLYSLCFLLQNISAIAHEYSVASLEESIDAFTDSLIMAPDNYDKIESIFNALSMHISSNKTDNISSLAKKSLKEKFIDRRKAPGNPEVIRVNPRSIDAILQKLWEEKITDTSSYELKELLKLYKAYNVTNHKRRMQLGIFVPGGLAAASAAAAFYYSKPSADDNKVLYVYGPLPINKYTCRDDRLGKYYSSLCFSSVTFILSLLAFYSYSYPPATPDFQEKQAHL